MQSDFFYNTNMNETLKQFKDAFIFGYTGRLGNVIDFQNYKTNKAIEENIDRYCNNPKISAVLVVIIAVAFFIYLY